MIEPEVAGSWAPTRCTLINVVRQTWYRKLGFEGRFPWGAVLRGGEVQRGEFFPQGVDVQRGMRALGISVDP